MGEPNLLIMDDRESGDALTLLARRWYFVLLVAVLVGAIVYVCSLSFLPKEYESSGAVFIDHSSSLGNALSSLPVNMSLSNGQGGYVVTLLQSDTMMRRIVDELELTNSPAFTHGQSLSKERAQIELARSVNVKQNKNGAVSIVARTTDPKLSSEIVNHMLDNLGKLFLSKSEKKARFISNKLAETEKKLEGAEQALLVFQTQHDVSLIDDQTRKVIRKLGDLDSQLIALDLQIQQTKSELANQGDLEELVKLRIKKTALEASRNVITTRIDQARRKLAGAPEISLEYARLQRSIAMLSKTVDLLAEQYQLAVVTQHGEDADYQVVDWAQVREEPVGPRNARNGALGAACGALLACILILSGRSKSPKHKPAPTEPEEKAEPVVTKKRGTTKAKNEPEITPPAPPPTETTGTPETPEAPQQEETKE